MYETLDVFRMSYAMAVHAGQKQTVVSQNVANADTPGYLARDIASFSDTFGADFSSGARTQRATRATHLNGALRTAPADIVRDRSVESSPNGNSVSLEMEMLKSVEAKREHDQALAIYKSSLNILRMNLAR